MQANSWNSVPLLEGSSNLESIVGSIEKAASVKPLYPDTTQEEGVVQA